MQRFNKKVVTLVIMLNVLFVAAVLYVILKVQVEPAALIVAWFGFTTGELWLMAGIEKEKIRQGR